MNKKVNIFWFRRDLRLDDNVGFFNALKAENPVLPIFIFDKSIIDNLPKNDARVTFIFDTLQKMRNELQEKYGSSLAMYYGEPANIFKELIADYTIDTVFTNHDYEPYAKERDEKIETFLTNKKITFNLNNMQAGWMVSLSFHGNPVMSTGL